MGGTGLSKIGTLHKLMKLIHFHKIKLIRAINKNGSISDFFGTISEASKSYNAKQ